jgi:acetolactate synthase regulatory subunit
MATIDERHDALRESVELLLIDSRENTKQIDKLTNKIDKLTDLITIDAENIRALARIAEAHESRLSDIEGAQ